MSTLPTRISRYEVHDRLGEGGMGILYLARDPLLDRTVAIKVLSRQNEELRERFAREARSAASLKHNHIVTVYDVGEDNGQPFIAMEYLDGETLAESIRRRAQPFPVTRKLQLMLELCEGLGYAHRRGIIHRDIKPANLMVTSDGVLKILDFGLARLATEGSYAGLTSVGVIIGTPHYMSPEAIEGRTVDHRADIFSTGLVLYELLTFRKAFPGDAHHAVMHSIVHKEPQPIRELYPAIDPDLERVVNKAIRKDPAQRYDRLDTLAVELTRIRTRLLESSSEKTVPLLRAPSEPRDRPSPGPPRKTPLSTPRHILENIAKRRAAQIEQHLVVARQRFDERDFDAAIEQCELAAVLDPQDARALALLEKVNEALEDRQVGGWLHDAEELLSQGAFSQAEQLVQQALKLRPASAEAQQLQRDVGMRRREHERVVQRARAVQAALGRARANFQAGAFEAAARSATEALAYDSSNDEARSIKQEALAALEQQRREHEHEQMALELVATARRLIAEGRGREGLDQLCAFEPPHVIVDSAIEELSARVEEIERKRREEEDARRRRELEEEQRRQEAERLALERAAAQRKQEEEERRRREAEEKSRHEAAVAHRAQARAYLEQGNYRAATAAANEARSLVPNHADTLTLLADIARAEREAERIARAQREEAERIAREQQEEADRIARIEREVKANLEGAAAALAKEQLTLASQLIERTVELAPHDETVLAMRARVREALEERRAQDARRRAAQLAATDARRLFDAGEHRRAIQSLETFEHGPLVAGLLHDLKDELAKIELRKLEDEERRRKEAQEARRREEERARLEEQAREARRRQEEEARRRREEEQARKQQEAELAERARKEMEERRRQAKEEKDRLAAEQLRLRQQEDEAREHRRREEEDARQRLKKAQKEEEDRVAAEQLRLRRQEDEARERRRQEEEDARQRKKKEQKEARLREKEEARLQKQRLQEEAQLAKQRAREARQEEPPVGPTPMKSRWLLGGLAAAVLMAIGLALYLWPRGPVPQPPPVLSRLVIDATPWAKILSVSDQAHTSLPLPAQTHTPLALDVPPGRYIVTLEGPDGKSQRVVDVDVKEAGGSTLVPFQTIDPLDYFKKAGS